MHKDIEMGDITKETATLNKIINKDKYIDYNELAIQLVRCRSIGPIGIFDNYDLVKNELDNHHGDNVNSGQH